MGFVVKNTTKCGLLDLVCPHTCRGCGRLGSVLCECCKKYMLEQFQPICPICKKSFAKSSEKVITKAKSQANFKVCPDCEMPFAGLWAFGWREGTLEKLVEQYKYQSVRAMGVELAELLDYAIPASFAGTDIVVVPLPTIGRHVRERGLDHTLLLAKKLAWRRGWQCQQLLGRAMDTVQVGAKVSERAAQAQKAYMLRGKIDPSLRYLLLDDVWTTGSTMLAAAKVLHAAGAKQIYGAVVAISPDKQHQDPSCESSPASADGSCK